MTRVRGQMSAFLVLLLLSCGGEAPPPATTTTAPPPAPPPPTVEQAATILSTAPELSDYQFTRAAYSLPTNRAMMNAPARDAAASLRKAGWIAFTGDEVVLTEKARGDKRFIVRPNDVIDIVPLAKKEFVRVSSVRSDSDGAPLVEFEWKWVPNEIGHLFESRYTGAQYATAKLMWDGSSWSVLRIEEFRPPAGG